MEYCCHVRAYAPSCNLEMLDMLDMLQERLCWTAVPAFAASFESLAYRQNKASLKVVSATFLLVCFSSLKESTGEAWKNDFYFTSEALFVLKKIKF